MQFFTLGSSKIEVFETCFFDIVTTQNDHPRYVNHFLGRIYVVFTLFRVCVWLGVESPRGGLAEGNRIFRFLKPRTPRRWGPRSFGTARRARAPPCLSTMTRYHHHFPDFAGACARGGVCHQYFIGGCILCCLHLGEADHTISGETVRGFSYLSNAKQQSSKPSLTLHPPLCRIFLCPPPPHPMAKFFIGGLARETTNETLTAYFEAFGELTDSVVMIKDGRPRGFGFVTYADPNILHSSFVSTVHIVDGKQVDVKPAVPEPELRKSAGVAPAYPVGVPPAAPPYGAKAKAYAPKVAAGAGVAKLFVGGLTRTTTVDMMVEHFGQFGTLTDAAVMEQVRPHPLRPCW